MCVLRHVFPGHIRQVLRVVIFIHTLRSVVFNKFLWTVALIFKFLEWFTPSFRLKSPLLSVLLCRLVQEIFETDSFEAICLNLDALILELRLTWFGKALWWTLKVNLLFIIWVVKRSSSCKALNRPLSEFNEIFASLTDNGPLFVCEQLSCVLVCCYSVVVEWTVGIILLTYFLLRENFSFSYELLRWCSIGNLSKTSRHWLVEAICC